MATEVRVKQRKRRLLVGGPVPGAVRSTGLPATLSNCGDLLKPLPPRLTERSSVSTRVMTSGMVTAQRMSQWMIRSQVLRLGAPRRPRGVRGKIGMQFND